MLSALIHVFKGTYLKRNGTLWVLIFVLPVGVSILMTSLLSRELPRNLPMGVVVEETSQLTGRIIKSIDASPTLRVETYCEDVPTCGSLMRSGNIFGFIMLPAGLEKKAYRAEAPVISVYTNAQSLLTSNLIIKELRTVVGTQGVILEPRNLPDPLRTEIHTVGNPTGSYLYFLAIGLVAAVFHVVAMISSVFVFSYPIREKKVTVWLREAKESPVIAVLGRWLPLVLILWVEMLLMMVFVRGELAPMGNWEFVMLALGSLAMIGTCTAVSIVFVGVTGSMRIATSAAAVVGGPAFAFSGQTFPVLAMPFFVRCFAFVLPITHFLQIQSAMLLGNIGLTSAFHSLQILLGMMIFWLLLGILTMSWQLKKCGEKEDD